MTTYSENEHTIGCMPDRLKSLCFLGLWTQVAALAITGSLSPSNATVGVTQAFVVGTATPSATVTETDIGPDGVSNGPFTTVANAQGNYSMGPFIVQQLGVYNGTLRDSRTGAQTSFSYSGSGNFATSVTTTSQSIQRGSSASFVVTLSSISGFAGTVNLAALNWSQVPGAHF